MKVSIITCSFNSKYTIQKTFNSVINQSYKKIEHIVIDGNSTDGTLDLIQNQKNPNIIWVSEDDSGIYDAMNKGIKLSSGEIIGTLNSDDKLFHENVIAEIVKIFESDPEIYCVYGNVIYRNSKGRIVRKWVSESFSSGLFEKSWTPAHPTFYCRRVVFEKFGYYKIDYSIAADVEFMFRILEINRLKSYYHNSVLVEMLSGGRSNKNLNSSITIIIEILRVFRENGRKLNIFKYVFFKIGKLRQFNLNMFSDH